MLHYGGARNLVQYGERYNTVMHEIRIETADDPRLDVYRSLKKTNENRNENVFVAEGVTVVERLFQSEFEVHSVLVSDPKMPAFRNKIPCDSTVYSLSRDVASELVGYPFHRGVLAAGHRREQSSLESVLPSTGLSLVFVADRIIDQQNLGLLIRIAAGFGADALLVTEGSADPFSRRAIRVSMGNGLFLPIVQLHGEGSEEIGKLASRDYSCCAAVLSDQAQELSSFSFSERTAIVFGNETHGVAKAIVETCEHQLMIAMINDTDSLNVAIAAGIFGYAYRAVVPKVSS